MRKFYKTTVAFTTLLLLANCSTETPIQSTKFDSSSGTIRGVAYNLPKPLVRINITTGSKTAIAPIAAKDILMYPDPTSRYIANTNLTSTSNDDFKISVNKNGLLMSVIANSKDATGQIVDELTSGLSNIIQNNVVRITERTANNKTKKTSILVDPFNIPQTYANSKGKIYIKIKSLDTDLQSRIKNHQTNAVRQKCPTDASLCVPVMVPIILTVSVGDLSTETLVVVPDPQRVIGIKIDRHACVETKSTLTLSDGILTNYNVAKPSQVAGCISIPLKVISAILRVPFDAITGRNTKLAAEQSALKAQTDLLKQQTALLAEQQNLANAKANSENAEN